MNSEKELLNQVVRITPSPYIGDCIVTGLDAIFIKVRPQLPHHNEIKPGEVYVPLATIKKIALRSAVVSSTEP